MTDKNSTPVSEAELESSIVYTPEAYICEDYARAERDKLWRKVWLQVGRVEDVPERGNFITYEILDDSLLIARNAQGELNAFHNVCPHRGRRLVDTPEGERNAQGKRNKFFCGFHGWQFDLDGENAHIPHKEDWQGSLQGCDGLTPVQCDTWGGWIWINMDPECEPLREYLEPAASMLDPFQLENMRCRWRKWGEFDCNWKVALEAFNETYHVQTTHPEFNRYGQFHGWAKAQGKHSNIGYDSPKDMDENQSAKLRVGTKDDPRISTAEMMNYTWEKANTNTTQTLVDAANRLADELPEGTPPGEVLQHWLATARKDDEARGVVWPDVDPKHVGESGTAWQIFPNFQVGHAVNNMLCYSARPSSYDPNKCIFEAAVYELYPEGEEPVTKWEYCEPTSEAWCHVLGQDFSNMAAVQKGMRSFGFSGPKPNPYSEKATANFHRNLARYMGVGAPVKLKP
ncbi:aromatic ring-hydroxylating oxygenase subunit alpha [Pseudomaricurvus sp.]|uniref:aromatic ring-hydroxylating oxygenase subunit alpha n=1 Tax=Pseudomaricurvus sp. TaxID=2004510 RepID=UPI003F6A71BC